MKVNLRKFQPQRPRCRRYFYRLAVLLFSFTRLVNETSNIFSPIAKGKLINQPVEKCIKQKLQKKYPLWVGGYFLICVAPKGIFFGAILV